MNARTPFPVAAASALARYRRLLVLAALVFAADQATKAWIFGRLAYGGLDRIDVIPGFFRLIHVGNTGAAWGLFQDRSLPLALLGAATVAAIFVFRRALALHVPLVQVAFGLLLGGIVGNLVDRLVHGHVVDFLDFRFGTFIWPTFNVADSGICVGVALYLWASFRHPALRG